MVVNFGKKPAQTVQIAFNNLTKPKLPKAEAFSSFKTIAKAVRKDPDQTFAKLGEFIKTLSDNHLAIAEQNIKTLPFIKPRLIATSILSGVKSRVTKSKLEFEKSVRVINQKYPEMIKFFTNLIMN